MLIQIGLVAKFLFLFFSHYNSILYYESNFCKKIEVCGADVKVVFYGHYSIWITIKIIMYPIDIINY